MSRVVCEAILLRAVDFSESDRIVHLLTPTLGRVSAIAKGARRSVKRFPGTLDLCNHLRIQLSQRRHGLAYLEQAVLLSPFAALRASPARFGLGCYMLELLDRLAPEGSSRDAGRLFGFALSALAAIERSTIDLRLRVLVELRTLDALGLRPELRNCVRCGREVAEGPRVAFHVGEGGVVCRGCAPHAENVLGVGLGTLRSLEQALRFDLDALERLGLGAAALQEAALLIHRFQRFHLGLELRSARFLAEILPGSP